ncbi:MAG: hypothetical protein AAFZ65_20055 [Planctomycetota bacterium]
MHFASTAALGLLVTSSLPAAAQSLHATQVVQFVQGAGGGLFDPALALGAPRGGGLGSGSLDVLTLGEQGSLTLGFDVEIVDGPGADLIVSENSFLISGSDQVFAEVLYVEVSSDGSTFARFPVQYTGNGSEMGAYRGVCGGLPVLANVDTNTISPFDPVVSGGEAFDLADLADDPAVTGGAVDLSAIRFVRLVDVGVGDTDDAGTPLGGFGGADVDAVTVLNSHLSDLATKPICDLELDGQNRMLLTIGDPQGFFSLDFLSLHASFDLVEVPLPLLLSLFEVVSADSETLVLRTPTLTGTGFVSAFAVSVADLAGVRASDQLMLQP